MPPAATGLYQLKITLKDTKPPIWRRLLIKPDTKLSDFHEILQVVMGWTNSHMHAFETKDGDRYGSPDMGEGDDLDERKAKLRNILPAVGDKLTYTYDFGDDWTHQITLEKIVPAQPGMKYPAVLAGKRNCPPEDCGGAWGYANLLDALGDPDHPDHEEMLEWIGGEFNPEAFSVADANAALHGG